MTVLVWANFPLALLFVLGWTGVPLWMTFLHPESAPDHSEARAYLAAKAALAEEAGAPEPARIPVPAGQKGMLLPW
jgi:hypothetical protein